MIMALADLFRESVDVESLEAWENERTPMPIRAFGVRFHSMGLSLRETAVVLDLLGVDWSHQAIFQWTHQLADSAPDPRRRNGYENFCELRPTDAHGALTSQGDQASPV